MTIAIDIDQDECCYSLKYSIQQSNAADNDDRHYLLHSNALISADNDDRHYLLHSNALISADNDDRRYPLHSNALISADNDDRRYPLHSNALISADNDDRRYPLHSNDLISFQRYNWLEEGTMNNIVMSVFGLEVRIMTTATATVLQTNSLIHEFKKRVHGM